MAVEQDIPVFSTQDLWDKYVTAEQPLAYFFGKSPEEFLITRLEDTSQLVTLPTQPHRRRVNEIVFVTGGRVKRGANLNTITISSGEIHLTLANQISTVDAISEEVTGYYCHFSLDAIIRLYHKDHMVNELAALSGFMRTHPVALRPKIRESVTAIFERLLDEYVTTNDPNLIDAYLVTLCYEIKNAIPKESATAEVARSHELTERFKQLVVQHIYQRHPIGFYARCLQISPNHLNKVVKQVTGKQAGTLIAEMLILESKVLLRHSDLTVAEIAYKLGFNDQAYFSRFFKQQTGFSPRSYKMIE